MTADRPTTEPRTEAWLEATVENALGDADFGKNDGGFDNGRPRKNVQRFIEALAKRGLRIEAEAAQGKEERAASPLEAIPGWMAEEEGGTYYRSEDVDALLASQGIWIAEGTGPIEAQPEVAQGAAPLTAHEAHLAHGMFDPVYCRACKRIANGDVSEGAAPRAEGLDAARERVRRFVEHWQSLNNPGDEVYRLYRGGEEHVLFVDDLARLSRPSDEREPGESDDR